jgi:hypothetical protein
MGIEPAIATIKNRREILRVEKNLNTIGVFTPRTNRPKENTKTIKTVDNLPDGTRVQASAKIISSPEYGLPITSDQDKFYAFTRILELYRMRYGKIENPIGFKSAELLRILGRKPTGAAYQEVDAWLGRMSATLIESNDIVILGGPQEVCERAVPYLTGLFKLARRWRTAKSQTEFT